MAWIAGVGPAPAVEILRRLRSGEVGVDIVGALSMTAAATGESLPARLARGADAMSGATNGGEAFDLTATREAKDRTYAGIVRLVEEAQASKAPMSRLADR
jgi:cation transport ATPase